MTGAERAGFGGAVLLAGAMVAAAILFIGRRDLPEGNSGDNARPDEVSTGKPAPEDPEMDLERAGARAADFRREILRLRKEVARRDAKIEQLGLEMRAAGVTIEEKPVEPVKAARELIDRLRLCGVETSPTEIEGLVTEIAALGGGGIPAIRKELALGFEVTFNETWSSYGGRFTALPSLRMALLDTLRRIAALAEGADRTDAQAAMVTLLRNNDRPLEAALLIGNLQDVLNVPAVAEEVLVAAKRFLTLAPHSREASLLPPVITVLATQSPEDTAKDLLAFYANPGRGLDRAVVVLDVIARLPEEPALDALRSAALLPDDAPRAARAAGRLARMTGEAALAVLGEVATGMVEPEVRSAFYRAIPRPVAETLALLERTAMQEGAEGVDRLDRADRERGARAKLLAAAAETEKDREVLRSVEDARKRMVEMEERSAKLRERLTGE